MLVFEMPAGLEEIAHFSLPHVQTWGSSHDQEYKQAVRDAAGPIDRQIARYAWFAFSIRCVVAQSRGRIPRQIPDVENIPKLIVDAFTGVLYPDDHIHHVRGVQVEAVFGPNEAEKAEVWIFACPRQ
jgi:Holliday junction resolvase RusA-like endonuclease